MKKIILLIVISIITAPVSGQNNLNTIGELHVSYGKYDEFIKISFRKNDQADKYNVYRSNSHEGPYTLAGEALNTGEETSTYTDYSSEPGILYYYRINPVVKGIEKSSDNVKPGYRKIDVSKKFNIDDIIARKNQSVTELSEIDKRRLSQLENEYMSWVKLKFFLFVVKPYIFKGTITVLEDMKTYSLDKFNNEILMYSDGMNYQIVLTSQRPFQILERTGDKDLLDILMKNSIGFCVYQGDVKIKDDRGFTKFIPSYEAVVIMSNYFKRNKNWSSSTIFISSIKSDLVQKIQQVSE